MSMPLLRDCEELKNATLVIVWFDYYLMLDGETFDDLHEVHSSMETYPEDRYIYLDPEEVIPYFFSTEEIGKELYFDTWEEAERMIP